MFNLDGALNKIICIIKKPFLITLYIAFFIVFYIFYGFAVVWNYFGLIILAQFINAFNTSFSSLEVRCGYMLISIALILSSINLITVVYQYMIRKQYITSQTMVHKALQFYEENSLYISIADITMYTFLIAIPYLECELPLNGLIGIIALKCIAAALTHGALIPHKIFEKLLSKFKKAVDSL